MNFWFAADDDAGAALVVLVANALPVPSAFATSDARPDDVVDWSVLSPVSDDAAASRSENASASVPVVDDDESEDVDGVVPAGPKLCSICWMRAWIAATESRDITYVIGR